MSPEEKPPEDLVPKSMDGASSDLNSPDPVGAERISSAFDDFETPLAVQEPVMAEMADDAVEPGANAELTPQLPLFSDAPPLAANLENISANGGAIGSIVLGTWCLIGSFLTAWSIINGVIGLLMGFWGLTSRKQKTAWIGIALCILGIFLSLIQVSELFNSFLNEVEEDPFGP